MVGSAKRGFSFTIRPKKVWQHFSEDKSEIDMVIISRSIFEDFWTELYDFKINLTYRDKKDQQKSIQKLFFKRLVTPKFILV